MSKRVHCDRDGCRETEPLGAVEGKYLYLRQSGNPERNFCGLQCLKLWVESKVADDAAFWREHVKTSPPEPARFERDPGWPIRT